MTTWLSTHGIGAIKDSASTFVINMVSGSAIVKPTTANQLTGWVHFTIPSPPVDNPDLKNLTVKFSSQSATVESVLVYLANSKVFEDSNLQYTGSFDLDIASTKAVYQGNGIAVSIKVVFTSVTGTLTFQSVGIQV